MLLRLTSNNQVANGQKQNESVIRLEVFCVESLRRRQRRLKAETEFVTLFSFPCPVPNGQKHRSTEANSERDAQETRKACHEGSQKGRIPGSDDHRTVHETHPACDSASFEREHTYRSSVAE